MTQPVRALPSGPVVAEYSGPRGFFWLVPGVIGGAAQPGIFTTIERDLAALARVGTGVLVSLTAEWQPPAALIAAHGIASEHLPIPDMTPPGLAEAHQMCAAMDRQMWQGRRVVYHCRAGKGRTGTMLVAQMIYSGHAPDRALMLARRRNPDWVESDSQIAFLHSFASHCAASPMPAAPALAGLFSD